METYSADQNASQPCLERSFELDRRLLSITEMEALSPGYTFALTGDAVPTVAIKVNGTLLARGCIIDMDGHMGVQVTEMM